MKTQTSHLDLHAHQVLAPLLAPRLRIAQYQKALRGFQRALYTLEQLGLGATACLSRRLEYLTQDFSCIGIVQNALNLTVGLAKPYHSQDWNFGVDYVVIGSSFGAKHLAKVAAKNSFPCQFFSLSAQEVAQEWTALWQKVQPNEDLAGGLAFDKVLEGALWTFDLYRLSMDQACHE